MTSNLYFSIFFSHFSVPSDSLSSLWAHCKAGPIYIFCSKVGLGPIFRSIRLKVLKYEGRYMYKSGKVLSVNRQIVVVTSRQIRCIKLYKTIKCLLYLNAVLHLLPSPQLHLNLSQQFWVPSPRKGLKFERDLVKTLSLGIKKLTSKYKFCILFQITKNSIKSK